MAVPISSAAAVDNFNEKESVYASPPPLTKEQEAIVKSTAPVFAQHGDAVTSHFYKRMLQSRPELRNIFNEAHQSTGGQPAALAQAVWAYAANIDNLGALTSAVSRIGHKHASIGIQPEHYPIVGEHLLASLSEVLGDAITPAIIDAWAAAYAQLANIFIEFERGLYQKSNSSPGGWNGWRKFKVDKRVPESDEIVSFYLEPVDGGALPEFKPGQYISVRLFVPELNLYQPRQYSLSEAPHGNHFRISVKKESERGPSHPAGKISNFLHSEIPAGSEIDVAHPYGDFFLDIDATTPAVLISGGVGLTPMLSMLGTITERTKSRQVLFIHAARNGKVHAMRDYLSQVVASNPQASKLVYYQNPGENDVRGVHYDHEGFIDLEKIQETVLIPDADYYLCGPVPFMKAHRETLERMGVPTERVHTEVFGVGIA